MDLDHYRKSLSALFSRFTVNLIIVITCISWAIALSSVLGRYTLLAIGVDGHPALELGVGIVLLVAVWIADGVLELGIFPDLNKDKTE